MSPVNKLHTGVFAVMTRTEQRVAASSHKSEADVRSLPSVQPNLSLSEISWGNSELLKDNYRKAPSSFPTHLHTDRKRNR